MTGLIALAAVIIIGSAIKLFTRSRIKNYEGIFNPETAPKGGADADRKAGVKREKSD
jgi:hypothetical protein